MGRRAETSETFPFFPDKSELEYALLGDGLIKT